ncbi:MAG: hypothetical protein VX610_02825 [SAR324 cluster bacterium]|nr:hypothetical protein [SAR324 cluster bacterium]
MSFFRWMRTKLLKILGLLPLLVLPLFQTVQAQGQNGGCAISPEAASFKTNQEWNNIARKRRSCADGSGRSSGANGFSRSSGPQGGQLSEPWLELPSLPIFSLGVGPVFQFSPSDSNIYGLRINVGYGTNEEVWGLDVGTINSTTSAYGLQIGGWNKTETFYAIQAGLVNSASSAYGPQLGIWNYTERIAGLQAGLFNSAASATGLQLSGWNEASEVLGLQLGGMNEAGNVTGFQFSLWNAAEKISGLQLGLITPGVGFGLLPSLWNEAGQASGQVGLRNVADSAYFFQIGGANTATAAAYGFQISPFYNRASALYGIQLGAVNVVTGSLNGLQIGLLNFSRGRGGLSFSPLINLGF